MRQQNGGANLLGLVPENDCADEAQQQEQTIVPSSRQSGCHTSGNSELSDRNRNLAFGRRSVPSVRPS
jgi:hypothetical protein